MDVDEMDPGLCYTWSLHDGKCVELCELTSYGLRTSLNMVRDKQAAAKLTPSDKDSSTAIAHDSSSVVTSTHVAVPRRGKVRAKPIPK